MDNFEYWNTSRLVFGTDTIHRISDLIPTEADILVFYGKSSVLENGVLQKVRQSLGTRIVAECGGILANPEYDTLIMHLETVKKYKKPFLLAVGGGSVLDGVKFIAAAALWQGDPWQILSEGKSPEQALPLASILTLPATGSEANGNAVISRASMHEKRAFWSRAVYPVFSILDPTTTYSLPIKQTANGLVDTFVHVCEQYLTRDNSTMVQDRLAEGILETLINLGRPILAAGHNYTLRSNLMWASTMALNGLLACGTVQDWSTHTIGHELTALYGLDHAQTLAIVLPGVLQYKKAEKFDKILTYAQRIWGLHQGDERVLVDEAIARTVLFFESLGLGTRLSDYKISDEAADLVAERFAARDVHCGEDSDIDADAVRSILLSRA